MLIIFWYVEHYTIVPDICYEKLHLLSERLAFLGIMGFQLSAPLNPLNMIECCEGPSGFRGALNWLPWLPRNASLSNRYTPDIGRFPSPDKTIVDKSCKKYEASNYARLRKPPKSDYNCPRVLRRTAIVYAQLRTPPWNLSYPHSTIVLRGLRVWHRGTPVSVCIVIKQNDDDYARYDVWNVLLNMTACKYQPIAGPAVSLHS